MAGGIQKGTVATDAVAKKLDIKCKQMRDYVAGCICKEIPGLVMKKKIPSDLIPGGVGACQPDGGAWFYKGELIAVFEGKKQGNKGNAIERWFKNHYICRLINPDVSYVTFAVGEGACEDGQIGKTLAVAHQDGFNTYVHGGNSCFLKKDGFSDGDLYDIMWQVLVERTDWVRATRRS